MTWTGRRHQPDPPTTPTRALDTTFTPSASRWTFVSYTIQLAAAAGQTATVELRSDVATPPTTVRCSATLGVVGSGDSDTVRAQLTHIVPPGENVRLVVSGNGTPTIANQTEIPFA